MGLIFFWLHGVLQFLLYCAASHEIRSMSIFATFPNTLTCPPFIFGHISRLFVLFETNLFPNLCRNSHTLSLSNYLAPPPTRSHAHAAIECWTEFHAPPSCRRGYLYFDHSRRTLHIAQMADDATAEVWGDRSDDSRDRTGSESMDFRALFMIHSRIITKPGVDFESTILKHV